MDDRSFVYVFSSGGKTKIGLADDVAKRAAGIRHAIGAEIEVHGHREFSSRKQAAAAERELHKRFGSCRLLGEWFDLEPGDAVHALNGMEAPEVHERPSVPASTEPASDQSDFLYETALAMCEGRATKEQIRQARFLIDVKFPSRVGS